MTRRELVATIALVWTLALLLASLHRIDRRRALRDLASLEAAICDVPLPRAETRALAKVHSAAARTGRAGALQAATSRLSARLAGDDPVTVFFEADSALWAVTGWSGPFAGAASRWPQAVGRWERVAWAPGCRGAVDGSRLQVARTVPLPGGRFVVLVASRWRNT